MEGRIILNGLQLCEVRHMFKANKGVSYTAREGMRQQHCKWTQAPEELGILQKDKLGEKFPTFVPNP